MALTKYVSAEWVHDEAMNTYVIKATGDDDNVYWISRFDSDVPPWPAFKEEGGQVTGQGPPQEPKT